MSQTQAAPQITGRMFLFEKPELLNREAHGKYGITQTEKPFAFCAKIRAAPITASEFISASRHYPIIFSAQKAMTPLAVLGVLDDVNLFVDDKGLWEDHAYVPGYLRRYPFALATETGGERVAVVFDAAHGSVAENGDNPLFENGEPSAAMQATIEFCQQYEADRLGADQAMKLLEEFDLVTGQSVQYGARPDEEQKTFAQYFGVEEKRLNELSDEKFLDLRKKGLLPLIHAQLTSMGNWRSLLERRAKRFNLTSEQVLDPLRLS
ncbi:MAG: SapC family protein [Amphiplicatus sp.]